MQFHLNCTLLTSGGLCTLLLFINVPAFSKHCRLLSFTSVLAQKQIDLKSMLGVCVYCSYWWDSLSIHNTNSRDVLGEKNKEKSS